MKDLFGGETPLPIPLQVKPNRMAENLHKQLITIYGKKQNETCKRCKHLYRRQGVYLKCTKASMSHSEASDWRAKWQACGQFESDKS